MTSEIRDIVSRLKRMSDADLSILKAALSEFDNREPTTGLKRIFGSKAAQNHKPIFAMTAKDSPNDLLWGAMAELGWTRLHQEPGELGKLTADAGARQYEFLPEASEQIKQAMTDAATELSEFADEVNRIYQGVCLPFLEQLMERVFAAGGNVPNAAMLFGVTLAEFAFRNGAEGQQEGAIDTIADIAKQRLADFDGKTA